MSAAISVVVPVYNAEKYLKECVASLLSQTFRDVEFIFVDDGSTDRSVEILEDYRQKDDRIQILRQQNQYAGVARNNGMKAATGKYIIFLDADDFFEPTMLEEAYNCAEAYQAQSVFFEFYFYDNQTHEISARRYANMPEGVFSPRQAIKNYISAYCGAPWNKLLLRSFIEETGLTFQPIKKYNDNFFIMTTAMLADKVVYLRKSLLYYRINNDSSLQGRADNGIASSLDSKVPIKTELKKRNRFDEPFRMMYDEIVSYAINYSFFRKLQSEDHGRAFYQMVKDRLIPEIYDSTAEFKNDTVILHLYESSSFEDFLARIVKYQQEQTAALSEKLNDSYRQIKEIYNQTVSIKSKDYKIGHAVLRLPRAVSKLFHSGAKQ